MIKTIRYKTSNYKGRSLKKHIKNLGIYAMDTRKNRKKRDYTPQKLRKIQKITKRVYKRDTYKTWMVLEFLEFMQWHVGETLNKKDQNLHVQSHYVYALRNNNVIYNPYELLLNLRKLLNHLNLRILYKKKCLINYAPHKPRKSHIVGGKPLEKYAKRMFLVTWRKWMGGVLTNFKLIAKRVVLQIKKKYAKKKIENYLVSYPNNIPRLPHFVVSTADSHWALNESRLMRIASAQLITSRHLGRSFSRFTLAMNTSYFALRRFTALLEECAAGMRQNIKLFHKNRILRRIQRKTKRKVRAKRLAEIFKTASR